MEVSVLSAVNVSILAMAVIFIVLTILIFTIKVLVKLLPYEAPPPAPQRHQKPARSKNGKEIKGFFDKQKFSDYFLLIQNDLQLQISRISKGEK